MIVVFGSINIDLLFSLPVLPQAGETVLGDSYRTAPGGKGANQAVAAARDGARVAIYGRVGRDAFGRMARESLASAGIDTSSVVEGDAPTGCAAVCVDGEGRNLIAVASGANRDLRATDVPDGVLTADTTLVLQMEAPPEEVAILAKRAKARGARVILNLAPALTLPAEAFAAIDVLIANEGEAATLAAGDPPELARRLATQFDNFVVVTLGGSGVVAAGLDEAWAVDALAVRPVDTTGAGDCFIGVLAAALDRGAALPNALHRASVAAGLACLAPGAQPSLPDAQAIDAQLTALAPARKIA
jgi:ribokinase